jgi:hypothetical protein
MKDRLLSIFLSFVRKTFSKDRLLHFISDLLDILYDNFGPEADCLKGGESDV